jgi:hypothetical protein
LTPLLKKSSQTAGRIIFVTAAKGLINPLVLNVSSFEPEVVDKIFIEIGLSEILAPVV